jgi:hypothetical protein
MLFAAVHESDVGTFRTYSTALAMSGDRGKAGITTAGRDAGGSSQSSSRTSTSLLIGLPGRRVPARMCRMIGLRELPWLPGVMAVFYYLVGILWMFWPSHS